MNRIKRRIDLYVHFLCGRVALLLDFHSSPYKISLGPSLYSCRQILMEVRSQIDECARWLGRVRNRRSNGWYRSIPCRVMCCRLDEMTFFLCQSPICLFTGIDIPIWTLAVVAAAAASIGYYMTTREFEKKKVWMKKSSCCYHRVFVQPSGSCMSIQAEIEIREWKEFIAFPAAVYFIFFIDVSTIYCYR